MSNGTPTPPIPMIISLVAQTGMPPIIQSKSRELIYDALEQNVRFIMNPYGPQKLYLSRPNHHW